MCVYLRLPVPIDLFTYPPSSGSAGLKKQILGPIHSTKVFQGDALALDRVPISETIKQ